MLKGWSEVSFSNGDHELFKPLIDSLLLHDTFMLFADFGACVAAQKQADEVYRAQERWTRMSILNAARMGESSSDRAIREYCEEKSTCLRLLMCVHVSLAPL